MVQAPDQITPPRSARDRRGQRRLPAPLSLLTRRQLTKVPQALAKPAIAWPVGVAEAPPHPPVGLQPREQTRGPMLMHLPTRVCLRRVVPRVLLRAREQPVAAGRVRVELTAGVQGQIGRLLHRLARKAPGRLAHPTTLATAPRDERRPIFVVMAPPGRAFLATPPGLAAPGCRPAPLGLSLVSSGVLEAIGCHRPCYLPSALIGQGGMA